MKVTFLVKGLTPKATYNLLIILLIFFFSEKELATYHSEDVYNLQITLPANSIILIVSIYQQFTNIHKKFHSVLNFNDLWRPIHRQWYVSHTIYFILLRGPVNEEKNLMCGS